jgi:UDP-2,4-diacetamido-2,4,6-trideoxy-beta-L-altropyranose hydrolase
MTTAPALVLRCDGDSVIGGGHVMRSLALAQAWRDSGGRAAFCAAALAPSLRQRLDHERFDVVAIEAAIGTDADADATIAEAGTIGATVAVVDGYQFPVDYRRRLRQAGLRVAAIDDNGEIGIYVDDVIVNQNRHAALELYPDRAGYTRLLLGTEYALLRGEFRRWRAESRAFSALRNILITLGAADPQNVTARVIATIGPAVPSATTLTVVIGGSNAHAEAVAERARQQANCRLVRNPGEDMPALMAAADLAICAGGSTMWELALMGVPFVPIVIAQNQRLAVRAMARDGYAAIEAAAVEADLAGLVAALVDADRREALSRIGRSLVDGKGVERVGTALRALAVA